MISVRHRFLLDFPGVSGLGGVPGSELEKSIGPESVCVPLETNVPAVPVFPCCESTVSRLVGDFLGCYGPCSFATSSLRDLRRRGSSFASVCSRFSRQFDNDGRRGPETFLLDEALQLASPVSEGLEALPVKEGLQLARLARRSYSSHR